jgi:hypothetical protein
MQTLSEKWLKQNRAGGVAQVVEGLNTRPRVQTPIMSKNIQINKQIKTSQVGMLKHLQERHVSL